MLVMGISCRAVKTKDVGGSLKQNDVSRIKAAIELLFPSLSHSLPLPYKVHEQRHYRIPKMDNTLRVDYLQMLSVLHLGLGGAQGSL